MSDVANPAEAACETAPDISYNPPCSPPCGVAWEFLSFSSSFALSTSVHVPRRRRRASFPDRALSTSDVTFGGLTVDSGRPVRAAVLLIRRFFDEIASKFDKEFSEK